MSFEALRLTNQGQELLLRSLEGVTINFTAIKVGDGTVSTEAIPELTDLVNPIHTTEISSATRTAQHMMIEGIFKNSEIPQSFDWRELGIFTANPDAPDDRSQDILFMYQNAYDTAEHISISSGEIIEKVVRINVFVGDAENVEALIDPATATVSRAEFDKLKQELYSALNGTPKLFHTEAQPAVAGPWVWLQPVRRRELDASAVVLELSTEEIQNNDVAMQMDGTLYKVENASADPNDVAEGEYLFDINP